MLVYLDTKDLIEVLDRPRGTSADELEDVLRSGAHKLVVTLFGVLELSRLFFRRDAPTIVSALLNRLEKMPLRFLHEVRIPDLEILEADRAFRAGREYEAVAPPFVDRFDEVVPREGPPATRLFINMGIAETVWRIREGKPSVLEPQVAAATAFRNMIFADRALVEHPSPEAAFTTMLRRSATDRSLPIPEANLDSLAGWIYQQPRRCPAVRLGYELVHEIRRNVTDRVEDSDIADFVHAKNVPYIDLMSLDRRMRNYVTQVSRRLGLGFENRLVPNVHDAVTTLRQASNSAT